MYFCNINNFLYINWDVSPIIFNFGEFEVKWYTFMLFIALMAGYYIYRKMITRENKPLVLLNNILFPTVLASILGARLVHCLFYEPEIYLSNIWKIFIPVENGKLSSFRGLSIHGVAIGMPIGLYYYSRINKISYLWVLDRMVVIISLVATCVRIGNLMNSEGYGHETNLPWGFVFLKTREIVPKHPAQIYEAFSYLLIFIFLYVFYLKKKPPCKDGVIMSLFLVLFFCIRFFLEFLKETQDIALNLAQLLSIPFVLFGFSFLFFFKNLKRKKSEKKIHRY
jgi:prolipoprotein diacylglyceryl transferase